MNQELLNKENLKQLRKWICDTMSRAGFDEAEFEFVELRCYGSRINGTAHENSDFDILLEYKGRLREDAVFNLLHDIPICWKGILVDINPIKEECSGTLKEYLIRCDNNWKAHIEEGEQRDIHRDRK